jgi:hypothetical protein
MTDWTDSELRAAFRSLEAPADPEVGFAHRLFDDLVHALDKAAAADPVARRTPTAPTPDDEAEPATIPLTPEALRRPRPDRRWKLLRIAAAAALVTGIAIGITRWRSDETQSLTATIPAGLVRLDEHCRRSLASVDSAVTDFDAATRGGFGPLSAENLRVLITTIDQFTAAALTATAQEDLPPRIRHRLEQAQALAASALRALDDPGPQSTLRARDAQYAARDTLAGALRIAADGGASACLPPW